MSNHRYPVSNNYVIYLKQKGWTLDATEVLTMIDWFQGSADYSFRACTTGRMTIVSKSGVTDYTHYVICLAAFLFVFYRWSLFCKRLRNLSLLDRFGRMVNIHLLPFFIFFVHIFAYGNNREYTNDRDGTRGTGFYDK